ncbi:MBL fold metallo-hydrolase [Nonomuraea lactucae]|uniref:MBL fold metallo-hydrolase n=1 Tax=Nonomuraea lactucae TaxID=2249762 RepID=UPI000DE21FCE|nr:MBL fold metallo-hydrolase [Nonomuraea lactucae]
MTIERWKVGEFRLTKIEETSGWTPLEFLLDVLPAATLGEIEAVDWLTPTYLRDGEMNTLVNSFLLETPTHKLVIDTGVGNGKKRMAPGFDRLDTDFLERFEKLCPRDQVDGVIFTHLHMDHVGWNTMLEDGRWQPTFPNARYCFVREEYEHWKAFALDPLAPGAYSEFGYSLVDAVAVFEDSLAPIEQAGLITWVEPGQEVVPGVTLISTAGHTPGHVAVLIEDAGESAVITGDLLHTQVQIARPDWSAEMDTDPEVAALTRKDFVERFADTPTLVIGTHFGAPAAGYIARDGSTYKLLPTPG